jgi:hypothetical protein
VIAKQLSVLLAVGLPVLYAGCGGDSLTLPSEGEPATIRVVDESDNQSGRVGAALDNPVIVQVLDTRNRPVPGVTVEFAVGDATSPGSASPPSSGTDANGVASALITLGPRVGPVMGRAWVHVPEGSAPVQTEFSATALPSNAIGIAAVSASEQSGPVGTALPAQLVVQVTDAFGNPIPNITVTWTVTGGGSVSETSNQTGANGQASVTRTLGPNAGPQTTEAAAQDLAGSPVAGSPVIFTHTATAGSASRVEKVSGDQQSGSPGSELAQSLVVRVLDAENNPIAGRAVEWVIGEGGGSASPGRSTTNDQGMASTQWTLGPSPGRNTLNAVVSGVGVGRVEFTATAEKVASTTRITSHEPEPSRVNTPVRVAFSVTGSGGTPTGTVTVTASGGSETCSGTVAEGFCNITLTSPGERRLTATYGGDARFTGSSDGEGHEVDPAPPANQPPTAEFSPPSCTAGQPCQFTDGSSDSDGNVVAWQWEFGDGGTSGAEDPSHLYATAGTYNVRLLVRDDDNATDDVTHQVTVAAAPPANTPPTAVADQYATPAQTPLVVGINEGLLNNDSDPEQDRFTLIVDQVNNFSSDEGLLIWDEDGSFDYYPGTVPTGTIVTFTYRVKDSQGALSNEVEVSITIQ